MPFFSFFFCFPRCHALSPAFHVRRRTNGVQIKERGRGTCFIDDHLTHVLLYVRANGGMAMQGRRESTYALYSLLISFPKAISQLGYNRFKFSLLDPPHYVYLIKNIGEVSEGVEIILCSHAHMRCSRTAAA